MRFILVLLLLVGLCGAADYGDINIRSGAGIAMDYTNPGDIQMYDGVVKNGSRDIINIKDYGATGDGVTDDTAAIQAAIDSMTYGDILYVPGGSTSTYNFSSVTFDPPNGCGLICHGNFSSYITTGNYTAFTIGDVSTFRLYYNIHNLKVVSATANWTENRVGILLLNIFNSNIHLSKVYGFHTNIKMIGDNVGCGYNTIHLGHIYDGKYGLFLTQNGTGWCNENTFYGGRLSLGNGFDSYVDTELLHIDKGSPGLNGNKFISQSFEGVNTTTQSANISCVHAYMLWPRIDGAGNITLYGTDARYNSIIGGYGVIFTKIEDQGYYNYVQTRNNIKMNGGFSDSPPITGYNTASAGYPSIGAMATDGETLVWDVDGLGRMSITNNAPGSSLGTVTGKWPIYDIDNNIIGYIPIYDTIT